MKEIKFRAWDKEFKRMLMVTELLFHNPSRTVSGFELIDWNENYSADYFQQCDDFIIMQYTGLKDKNGTPIYEGDIVRNKGGKIDEVIFHQGCFCYELADRRYHIFDQNIGEVIGNIYENPGLLEE